MSNPVLPKRAGDDFARAYDGTTKKPRFDYRNPSTLAADAPEDDPILNLDTVGKSGREIKRNAVNIDGYESDSDDDTFADRARDRAKRRQAEEEEEEGKDGKGKGKSQMEDEIDMFADLEEDVQGGTADGDDDEELAAEQKRRKKVRFMQEGDEFMKGQVAESKSGGHVAADLVGFREGREESVESESSSGDDEARDELPEGVSAEDAAELGAGGKRKHAPRLDAFHLQEEQQEGKFDEAGNYLRKAVDPDAVNDNWLEGVTNKDIKRAREAQEAREAERRRKAMEKDAILTTDLLSQLCQYLETGETPLEALQRLGKSAPPKAKKVPAWKLKKLQQRNMDIDPAEEDPAVAAQTAYNLKAEKAREKAINAITGAADALSERSNAEVYDQERELFLRQYQRESGEAWKRMAIDDGLRDGQLWQFRWKDGNGKEHGPYKISEIEAWQKSGQFNKGEGVEFRHVKDLGKDEWRADIDV